MRVGEVEAAAAAAVREVSGEVEDEEGDEEEVEEEDEAGSPGAGACEYSFSRIFWKTLTEWIGLFINRESGFLCISERRFNLD